MHDGNVAIVKSLDNTHVLSWKKHTNINILMIGGQKSLQFLEQQNSGFPLLRDLGKLFWMLSRM